VAPIEHKHGSRLAIVFSGSLLFTGGAGSGESNIRQWIIENDWLEAIIALPEQMFYNTGIGTYVWIITNRKEPGCRGRIRLLDEREVWTASGSEDGKRSLGDKRRHLTQAQITEIVRRYGSPVDGETIKSCARAGSVSLMRHLTPADQVPASWLADYAPMAYVRGMLTIIESPLFTRLWPDYWSEEERADFASYVAANPEAGDVVPGSGGCR
jgi:type I restriction-modification system DNA methylase subunit